MRATTSTAPWSSRFAPTGTGLSPLGARVASLVVALFLLAGCASATPERQVYNGIAVVAKSVDVGMSVAGDLYRAGKITEQQKDKIVAAHGTYQKAARVAIAGARTYQSRADADRVLDEIRALATALLKLIEDLK